jgi:hypothetical protein
MQSFTQQTVPNGSYAFLNNSYVVKTNTTQTFYFQLLFNLSPTGQTTATYSFVATRIS